MKKTRKDGPTIGCLVIEDPRSGGQTPSGLFAYLEKMGIAAEKFGGMASGDVYGELLSAYQKMRASCGQAAVIGMGWGMYAAAALACQIPVDRIVLLSGEIKPENMTVNMRRQAARIARFAARNAMFLTSPVLIADFEGDMDAGLRRLAGGFVSCPVSVISHCGMTDKKVWTNDERNINFQIYHFIRTGELPKSLAENPEMCIIYE